MKRDYTAKLGGQKIKLAVTFEALENLVEIGFDPLEVARHAVLESRGHCARRKLRTAFLLHPGQYRRHSQGRCAGRCGYRGRGDRGGAFRGQIGVSGIPRGILHADVGRRSASGEEGQVRKKIDGPQFLRLAYQCAREWGIQPSEFAGLSLAQWWAEYDSKLVAQKKATKGLGGVSQYDWEQAKKAHKAKEAAKNGGTVGS